MLKRIRDQIGTAGLVVAIVALVVALGGGAYAASKQFVTKPEATKIAKKYAGKEGPKGAPGTNGTNGTNGKDGAAGKEGAKGKSVVLKEPILPEEPECAGAGGYMYEVEGSGVDNEVCNGEKGPEGSPWTAGGTLPKGSTETGTWSFFGVESDNSDGGAFGGELAAISIPIPLAKAIPRSQVFYQGATGFTEHCSGSSPIKFSAKEPGVVSSKYEVSPGVFENKSTMCIFKSGESSAGAVLQEIWRPEYELEGAGPSGAILQFHITSGGSAFAVGSWAVEAE